MRSASDLSLDDFGIGYSSLALLKRLPVQELKIDRSFVMSMAADGNDAAIVRLAVQLAHNLGLHVVAEGVETADAWDQLTEMGCQLGQGYYLSRSPPKNSPAGSSAKLDTPPHHSSRSHRSINLEALAPRRQPAADSC